MTCPLCKQDTMIYSHEGNLCLYEPAEEVT